MRVRHKSNHSAVGWSAGFNMHALCEVIVHYDDEPDGTPNGAYSCFCSDLEVQLSDGTWIDLNEAFESKKVITDNLNSDFREPATPDEIERGYYY